MLNLGRLESAEDFWALNDSIADANAESFFWLASATLLKTPDAESRIPLLREAWILDLPCVFVLPACITGRVCAARATVGAGAFAVALAATAAAALARDAFDMLFVLGLLRSDGLLAHL